MDDVHAFELPLFPLAPWISPPVQPEAGGDRQCKDAGTVAAPSAQESLLPCNYKLYPINWLSEIRPLILRRAGERPERHLEALCESCGIPNHSKAERGVPPNLRLVRIVLTIAHLDQDIQNNDPENLAALCQACHLDWDRPWALIKSSITRDKTKRQKLFSFATAKSWITPMAKEKLKHSFNVIISEKEMTMLSHLAEKQSTNKSVVLRQALRYRYEMDIRGIPTCSDGRNCFVPHMHAPQPTQQEPIPPCPPIQTLPTSPSTGTLPPSPVQDAPIRS